MELVWYSFLLFLTFSFALNNNIIINQKLFFWFWIIIALITSVIVRAQEFTSDIKAMTYIIDYRNYTNSINPPELSDLFIGMTRSYFFREPIVWFSLRIFYRLFDSAFLAFFLVDLVSFIFLFKGISLQKYVLNYSADVKYLYFAIFLFLPFLFGLHYFYRQYIATIFLLCAIGYVGNKNLWLCFIFFLCSVLSHNVAVLFLPLLLYLSKLRLSKPLAFISLSVIPFVFYYKEAIEVTTNLSSKSNKFIGGSIGWYYFGLLALVLLLILTLRMIKKSKNDSIIIFFGFVFSWISFWAAVLVGTEASERLFFFILAIMYPLFSIYLDYRLSIKLLTRTLIIITIFLPLIHFSGPLSF